MTGRSRGKPFRGGGRGHYGGGGGGGQWISHRGGGRGGFRGGNHRGGGGGYRGGGGMGGRQDHYHMNRDMRGGGGGSQHRQHDPEKLLSNLAPEAQLALTTAIINSVLKTDGRESRGNYREREYRPNHRDGRREGRGGYFREEQRDRRHYGDDRRPHDSRPMHEDGRGHHYEREKSAQGPPRYRNNRFPPMHRRRPSPHSHMGQARKRMRMERMSSMEGDNSPRHNTDYDGDEMGEQERKRPRDHKHRSPGQGREREGRDEEKRRRDSAKDVSPDGSGGVQVTIRADGERNVNNEGNGRPGGIHFVDLRCPHCPGQMSITFKEYKFHLSSEAHKGQLNRLARKHSVVLRKIRVQQRQEQRDIEGKWKDDNAEEFKSSVTRFCNTCKLAYKCPGNNTSEGISQHNSSKLHRMQQCYLHPRCGPCRSSFPSRMVYEYHIASIHHLRAIDKVGRNHHSDDQDQDDDDDELDLANFMTLDAVGEDDEVGSEHEEITGGLDGAEAAKEAETGRKQSSKSRFGRHSLSDDEESVDWAKDKHDDDDEENESVGSDYVNRIDAYYCSLCSKIFRADTSIGSRAVQRHCRSFDHLTQYQDAHPPIAEKEEEPMSEGEGEGDEPEAVSEAVGDGDDGGEEEAEEDPEQEKLWDEVDKGLDMLQGEIMSDIEAEDSNTALDGEENGKTKKLRKRKTEKGDKSDNEEVENKEGDEEEEEEEEQEVQSENNEKRASSEEQDEEPNEQEVVEVEYSDEEK